jgi:diguanylate cyclase (GGDEF)-like protein/PAS domain S-box-containing protein
MGINHDIRHILVVEDQKSKRIVALKDNNYSIGRDPTSSIIIYDRQVSRHHATLLRVTYYNNNHDYYRIIDGNLQGKKSTNGILINGKYSLSHELKHGDMVRFGNKAKASYHVLKSASELDLFKASEKIDALPEAELASTFVHQYESTDEEDGRNTIIFHAASEDKQLVSHNSSSLAEYSPNPIIELNFSGEITYINPIASIKFPDLRTLKAEHPIVRGLVGESFSQEGTSYVREVQVKAEFFEQHIHYLGDSQLIRSYIFDITKYKNLETKLNHHADYYKFLVEQASEGIFLVDVQTKRLLEANRAYCDLLGYQAHELINHSLYQIIAVEREILENELAQITPSKSYVNEEALHRKKDGDLVGVESRISRQNFEEKDIFCFVVRDNSERKQHEERLQHQVFHDSLTNLPNRILFNNQLTIALSNAERNQCLLAVLFLDLDSFQSINNSFGHTVGDQLLQSFARRLTSCIRGGDIVARWGSDEFAILLPRIKNADDATKLTQRIFETLKQPFPIDKHQLQVKASIGIAIYPQDGQDRETLLKNVDAALGQTKITGRSNYQFYTPKMTAEALASIKIETLLHQAPDREEFCLYYQPQVRIQTGEITGMEALLRWKHPELGLLTPAKFLHLAEKTDLMLHVSKWVLKTACEQNLAWQKAGLPFLPISVNLSNREWKQPNLVTVVARVLDSTGLDPHLLELEITEKTLRENLASARQVFQDFHNLGVRIALDDFGTGISSMGYLKQFSFRTLKIHQVFIRDLRGNQQDLSIISALLGLGRGFNLRIIAEGVETQQQVDILQSLQCEEAQGYYFHQPIDSQGATKILTDYFSLDYP